MDINPKPCTPNSTGVKVFDEIVLYGSYLTLDCNRGSFITCVFFWNSSNPLPVNSLLTVNVDGMKTS